MNTLNREVMSEFRDIVGKIQNDPKVRAVVISSAKPDCFIAGADVAYVFQESCQRSLKKNSFFQCLCGINVSLIK